MLAKVAGLMTLYQVDHRTSTLVTSASDVAKWGIGHVSVV
jgi:hypothetical protein